MTDPFIEELRRAGHLAPWETRVPTAKEMFAEMRAEVDREYDERMRTIRIAQAQNDAYEARLRARAKLVLALGLLVIGIGLFFAI